MFNFFISTTKAFLLLFIITTMADNGEIVIPRNDGRDLTTKAPAQVSHTRRNDAVSSSDIRTSLLGTCVGIMIGEIIGALLFLYFRKFLYREYFDLVDEVEGALNESAETESNPIEETVSTSPDSREPRPLANPGTTVDGCTATSGSGNTDGKGTTTDSRCFPTVNTNSGSTESKADGPRKKSTENMFTKPQLVCQSKEPTTHDTTTIPVSKQDIRNWVRNKDSEEPKLNKNAVVIGSSKRKLKDKAREKSVSRKSKKFKKEAKQKGRVIESNGTATGTGTGTGTGSGTQVNFPTVNDVTKEGGGEESTSSDDKNYVRCPDLKPGRSKDKVKRRANSNGGNKSAGKGARTKGSGSGSNEKKSGSEEQ